MSDTIVEEQPASTELPAEVPIGQTAPTDDELTALLREFDEKTAPRSEPESSAESPPANISADQSLDDLLKEFAPSADRQRADALQGQLNELQIQMHRERELAEFNSFADDLGKQVAAIAPHVQDDWVRLKLESYTHDPLLRLAWDTRSIDAKAAALDLAHVQVELRRLQADPNADQKRVQELNHLGYQLSVAANSASILRQARNQILNEAKRLKPPIDPEATADRDAVAQAIREGSTNFIPEPKIDFATMTNKEFEEWCRKNIRN